MKSTSHHYDPRESYNDFPSWTQPLLTLISGKPRANTKPLLEITPVHALIIDISKYIIGVGSAVALTEQGGLLYFLLPLSWVLTVNAARSLTSDAHYAGHSSITGKRTLDKLIGDLLSLSVLAPNMDDYALPHNRGHHGRGGIGTIEDPDSGLIRLIGFEMGKPLAWYKLRLLTSLISLRYHFLYTKARLRSTLITAPVWRKAAAIMVYGGIVAAAVSGGWFSIFLLAWLIPILPLYAVSAALQFPSEHLWLAPREEEESHRDYFLRVSHGRFFLLPAPESWRDALRWSLGMGHMLFERFFVCVSILPAHDYHHRHPGSKRWPMEPWLRQKEVDSGIPYTEFYGLKKPTEAQFAIWSKTPPLQKNKNRTLLSLLENFSPLIKGTK
ncbi:MAG: fatty acid desaturase [Endozoicomonas sp.]|uniref:fatty acid desaturase n=1 Tax=Endozoicomonas sp. TaxID=1892382 RepID=UPI003D9B6636